MTETLLIGDNVTGKEISVIKDPFKKDCVTEVNIFFRIGWNGEHRWTGSVGFVNGNTAGRQDIPVSPTFEEAVANMKTILNSVNQ